MQDKPCIPMDKVWLLLTYIYDVQMSYTAVVASTICSVLLDLKTLQIEGYPHPFSKGRELSTLDQDSESHTIKVSIILACDKSPYLFCMYSDYMYDGGPLSCHDIWEKGHGIPLLLVVHCPLGVTYSCSFLAISLRKHKKASTCCIHLSGLLVL